MPHCITYSDDYEQTFGSRTVDNADLVIDRILSATGWTGTIVLEPDLPHIGTILINPHWRSKDASGGPPDRWSVEMCFHWPELSGDSAWFTYNLCAEKVERDVTPVAEIVGVPIRIDERESAGTGSIDFWFNDIPGGVVGWPAATTLTYQELLSIATGLDAYLGAVSEAALPMSAEIQPVHSPEQWRRASKVFLCHSSRDKPFARQLARALRAAAVDVWFDEDEILVGHDFVEMMQRGLEQARFVVVVLSPNFTERGPWAREELRHALEKQVRTDQVVLLPVLLADCEIPSLMRSKSYADFRDSFEVGFERLIHSIAAHAPGSRS